MIPLNINPATKETYEHICYPCTNSIYQNQTDKIIRNMVRMPASLHTLNLATSHVYNECNSVADGRLNWNQASDRNVAHIQTVIVPSRGDSTRQTLTRARPGACSAGGKGVDVKHGSYDRYLARLKGKSCKRAVPTTPPVPLISVFNFKVGDYCWALLSPEGPFYKAQITNVEPNGTSQTCTISFINGDSGIIRDRDELLTYNCSC